MLSPNKQCYESNLKILILSIGLCLRSIQPDICNRIAFKQNCIYFEKCRWQKQPKHYSSLNIMTSQHDIRYLLYYRPITRRHKICSVSLHLITSKMSEIFQKICKIKSFNFTYKSKIFLYIVSIEMNNNHIFILKAIFLDKCGQATWYDHTDFGGFLRLSLLVLIISPTSIGVLKCLFCVYFKHGIRLLCIILCPGMSNTWNNVMAKVPICNQDHHIINRVRSAN